MDALTVLALSGYLVFWTLFLSLIARRFLELRAGPLRLLRLSSSTTARRVAEDLPGGQGGHLPANLLYPPIAAEAARYLCELGADELDGKLELRRQMLDAMRTDLQA